MSIGFTVVNGRATLPAISLQPGSQFIRMNRLLKRQSGLYSVFQIRQILLEYFIITTVLVGGQDEEAVECFKRQAAALDRLQVDSAQAIADRFTEGRIIPGQTAVLCSFPI